MKKRYSLFYMDDKKNTLRLNNKKHTGFGICSFILSIISFIVLLIAIIMSAIVDRTIMKTMITVGILEILGALFCVVGLIYGILGCFSKDTFKTFSHFGIILNSILMIIHIIIVINAY